MCLCLHEYIISQGDSSQSTFTGFLQPLSCSTCSLTYGPEQCLCVTSNAALPVMLLLCMCRHVRYCLNDLYPGMQQLNSFLLSAASGTRFSLSEWNIWTYTQWIANMILMTSNVWDWGFWIPTIFVYGPDCNIRRQKLCETILYISEHFHLTMLINPFYIEIF